MISIQNSKYEKTERQELLDENVSISRTTVTCAFSAWMLNPSVLFAMQSFNAGNNR